MAKNKKQKLDSYLVLELQAEMFAINVSKVLSILQMQKITTVPQSPDYMMGVINLRGKVIPVIDSHVKFNLEPLIESAKTNILVLEIGKQKKKALKLGLLVDKVNEVIQISEKAILPPPSIGDVFQSEYISGVYQKNEKDFIMILDIEKALSMKEIVTIKAVAEKENTLESEEKIVENENPK